MTIHIKESHIRNGRPWLTMSSPIALALRDAGFEHVVVENDHFTIKGYKRKIPLPKEAVAWQFEFDKYHKGKPFEFEISER